LCCPCTLSIDPTGTTFLAHTRPCPSASSSKESDVPSIIIVKAHNFHHPADGIQAPKPERKREREIERGVHVKFG
jgi:hypothetical protein